MGGQGGDGTVTFYGLSGLDGFPESKYIVAKQCLLDDNQCWKDKQAKGDNPCNVNIKVTFNQLNRL